MRGGRDPCAVLISHVPLSLSQFLADESPVSSSLFLLRDLEVMASTGAWGSCSPSPHSCRERVSLFSSPSHSSPSTSSFLVTFLLCSAQELAR